MKILENPTYKLIKEHIGIILLLPAFLGGVWQVVELSSISTSFIRFFSVSQLVADGTLILFLLTFVYFGLRIVKHFFKDSPSIFDPKSYNSEVHKSTRNINILLMFITGIIMYFALFPDLAETFKTHKLSPIIFLIVIPMTIILVTLFISSLITVVMSFGIKMPFKNNKHLSDFTKAILGLLILIYIIKFSLFMMTSFHRSFLLPDNFKNLEYIKCKINKNNGLSSDPEILYFNDKYIFIEFKKRNTKQIEILSFDNFLEYNNCDTLRTTL